VIVLSGHMEVWASAIEALRFSWCSWGGHLSHCPPSLLPVTTPSNYCPSWGHEFTQPFGSRIYRDGNVLHLASITWGSRSGSGASLGIVIGPFRPCLLVTWSPSIRTGWTSSSELTVRIALNVVRVGTASPAEWESELATGSIMFFRMACIVAGLRKLFLMEKGANFVMGDLVYEDAYRLPGIRGYCSLLGSRGALGVVREPKAKLLWRALSSIPLQIAGGAVWIHRR